MSYRYDLHCHTKGVSACGTVEPEEGAKLYIEAGYSGVVITNHINNDTFRDFSSSQGWQERVDFYLTGWQRFKAAAGGRLTVLLGAELRFPQNDNDYLVYGVTEGFLRETPGLMGMDVGSFSMLAREKGLLFFQAHPFRNNMTVVNPACLDGIEVYNGHPRHESRNAIALAWAEKYGLLQSSGSDFHDPDGCALGGIETETPIASNEELLAALKKQPRLLRLGKDI